MGEWVDKPTMRGKSIDRIWSDNIVRPGIPPLLRLPQIIFLVVIEIEPLIVIPRERLLQRHLHWTEMHPVVLHSSASTLTTASNYQQENSRMRNIPFPQSANSLSANQDTPHPRHPRNS